jgi:hypothetical protein
MLPFPSKVCEEADAVVDSLVVILVWWFKYCSCFHLHLALALLALRAAAVSSRLL